MEEQNMQTAQQVYQTLCQALEQRECRYTLDEENMAVYVRMRWLPDAPVMRIFINGQRQRVTLQVLLPFEVRAVRRLDMAVAVAAASCNIPAGCLSYDLREGCINYRINESYMDSRLSPEYFYTMLDNATKLLKRYVEKLDKLNEGTISLQEFLQER